MLRNKGDSELNERNSEADPIYLLIVNSEHNNHSYISLGSLGTSPGVAEGLCAISRLDTTSVI